jgi:hypothetical protein
VCNERPDGDTILVVIRSSIALSLTPFREQGIPAQECISVIQTGAGVTPPTLIGSSILSNGAFHFSFANTTNGSFTVLSTTNLTLPFSSWTVVGTAANVASGQFQFTSQPTTNDPELFYGVRSP